MAELDISPCTGCVACGYEGPCAQADDMDELRGKILSADMLVFATPLYYYGMTAQLKAVIFVNRGETPFDIKMPR